MEVVKGSHEVINRDFTYNNLVQERAQRCHFHNLMLDRRENTKRERKKTSKKQFFFTSPICARFLKVYFT